MKKKELQLPVVDIRFPLLKASQQLRIFVNGHLVGLSNSATLQFNKSKLQLDADLTDLDPILNHISDLFKEKT